MRILTLNANLKDAGTYYRCFYFSRELARHGHDVTMITVSRASRFRPRTYFTRDRINEQAAPAGDGPWVRMIEGPRWGYKLLPGWGYGPLDIWLRLREILTGDYDLIYGFEYQPNVSWPVYLTRPLKHYRFYSDWCDWHAGGCNVLRGWKLAHKVDGFFEEHIRLIADKVTTSVSLLRQRAVRIGVPEHRIAFVAQGCDSDYITPVDIQSVRKQLNFPLEVPIVGMGIEIYWRESLEVFQQIRQQIPAALLLIIGHKQAGLREYAERLGLGTSVIETGWVSDVEYPLYLSIPDVLFLVMKPDLSDLGRWPGILCDYLAAGRPTVVTDVGESAAFIKQHQAGLTVSSLEELADQIVHLLKDTEARRFYGAQARQAVITGLDWRVLGEVINQVVVG